MSASASCAESAADRLSIAACFISQTARRLGVIASGWTMPRRAMSLASTVRRFVFLNCGGPCLQQPKEGLPVPTLVARGSLSSSYSILQDQQLFVGQIETKTKTYIACLHPAGLIDCRIILRNSQTRFHATFETRCLSLLDRFLPVMPRAPQFFPYDWKTVWGSRGSISDSNLLHLTPYCLYLLLDIRLSYNPETSPGCPTPAKENVY